MVVVIILLYLHEVEQVIAEVQTNIQERFTMKTNIWILGLILAVTLSFPAQARHSQHPSAYGPEAKRFGIGVYAGEPTGLTLKGYLTQRAALNGVAAWSFPDDAITLIGDLNYELFDIPVDSKVLTLPFYLGVGGKVALDAGQNDDTEIGVRVPVGVGLQWVTSPIEIFFEVVPGIVLVPETKFDIMGGLGLRFYF